MGQENDATTLDGALVDVRFEQEPVPTIAYRSHLIVYEEALVDGRFVGRCWNGAGFMSPWEDVRTDPAKHPTPQAFWIELDGQLLHSHWTWGGLTQEQRDGTLHAAVTLIHAVRPVTVRVHTVLDGTPIMTRWIEIANTSDRPASLSAVYPWSGVLLYSSRPDVCAAALEERIFSLGYMASSHWGMEGDFAWKRLPVAAYRIQGRYRRGRHRHPMFVLRNDVTGEHLIGQLAWSGGYAFEFDLDAEQDQLYDGGLTPRTALSFKVGPDAPAPQRVIAAGETVATPEVHLGMIMGDLDETIQAMHDHLRRSVLRAPVAPYGAPVEGGIGPELEITEEAVYKALDTSAALGAEVFFIDASWYAPPHSNWWETVGDWQVGSRFPAGLAPFRDRAHELGMKFGLWMEPERLGGQSRLALQHPEWIAQQYDGRSSRGHLDLTQPAVAAWMEDQIGHLLDEHRLDFFRLDYNIVPGAGYQTVRDGCVENHYWRYYDALYGIFARLRERFPTVIFENCAGGGGRTDIGMMRHFDHTWVTDWQIAPRSFWIINGMSMALPPEYVDRVFGGQNAHVRAEIDFQARLILFGRPTVGIVHPSPLQLARLRRAVSLYKDVVRPFHRDSRIYHHTPSAAGSEHPSWGVLELAARDGTRAVAGLFRVGDGAPEYVLRLRGVDVSRRYAVTFDNAGQTCVVDGLALRTQGLTIRLESALTSELLIVQAVDA